MKLLRYIADKLYKYSSYARKEKKAPFLIKSEQKQLIKVRCVVNLPIRMDEEAVKEFLVSGMKKQLEGLIKIKKIAPSSDFLDLAEWQGEIEVVKE